jgi:hypothetical protein
MAELLAAGTALFATAGGTAATAATTAAVGTAAAGSSALSILQGVATAVSALGAIGGGFAAMQASNEQADQVELQAGQEQLQAQQRKLAMTRELHRILGENDVAFAAGGVDVTGGIAAESRADATAESVQDMTIDRDQDEYRRALLKVRARGLRRRGGEQMFSGLLGAASAGLNFGMDLAERGGPRTLRLGFQEGV